jgi:hypothetical protein
VHSSLFYGLGDSFEAIRDTLTSPAFIIQEKEKALYFFRAFGINKNFLVETVVKEDSYVAFRCVYNPSKAYVASLLLKGSLMAF